MGPFDWVASQYLDDDRWGILDAEGHIIVGLRHGLSRDDLAQIVSAHNQAVQMATQGQVPAGWQKRSGW